MNKYYLIAKSIAQTMLIYRVNFFLWRARQIMQVLISYYLWLAIIPSTGSLGSYDQSSILTYVFITGFIGTVVYASRSVGLSDEINNGNLANDLLKPYNYFVSWFATDLGDKIMNTSLAFLELIVLFFLLKPPLMFQTDPLILLLTMSTISIATVMYFFFNLLLGSIGFWSPEVWGPRFIFMILLTFFSGGLFPLDLLPTWLYGIFQFLPFPYLLYFPTKLYLGQLSQPEIVNGLIISLMWLVGLYVIVQLVWNKGLRNFTAQGR